MKEQFPTEVLQLQMNTRYLNSKSLKPSLLYSKHLSSL